MQSHTVNKARSVQEIDAEIAALEKRSQELKAERAAITNSEKLTSTYVNMGMFKPVEMLNQERKQLEKQKTELSHSIRRTEACINARRHNMAHTVINHWDHAEVVFVSDWMDYGRIWKDENEKLTSTQNRLDELDAFIKLGEVRARRNR